MKSFTILTPTRTALVNITSHVSKAVTESGIRNGAVVVYVPHTTCGITINEAADPDVAQDILMQLDKTVPRGRMYRHREGNADAHIKTSLLGTSATVLIEDGQLVLGTWQGIFLGEFDGPRNRKVYLQFLS
ncbi:MAG: YjbQ family protein [Candidatus Neomarinimicrobiota bacterium]|nr:MAG: YjbQ family protein [Candidatus Neomarinimicrobiota bacterium]